MDLLEEFFEHPPKIENFIPRKVSLEGKEHTNLFGPRGCGKSTLALSYMAQNDNNILYIDLEEPKLLMQTYDTLPIQEFIDEYDIDELILDHFEEELELELPQVSRIILISKRVLNIDGFKTQKMLTLDFEEFLAFDYHNSSTIALNHFFKTGTLPITAKYQKSIQTHLKLFFQNNFLENEQSLLLILAKYNTHHLTTNQIYTYTKEYFRVSKDFVYSTIKRFQEEEIIYMLDNHIKRSGKKLILYDFAFAKYLSINHSFINSFDTLIAISLIKHHESIKAFGLFGYIVNDEVIIPAPFESEESIWRKSQNQFNLYKKHKIDKVTIITVANSFSFTIDKITFEAIPFTEWSIIDE